MNMMDKKIKFYSHLDLFIRMKFVVLYFIFFPANKREWAQWWTLRDFIT